MQPKKGSLCIFGKAVVKDIARWLLSVTQRVSPLLNFFWNSVLEKTVLL